VTQTLDWADVMTRVPRERFIPDVIWRHDRERAGNDLVPVDRRTDPAVWEAMVAADGPVITQVDNGHPTDDGMGVEATSSCSDRDVVREMLELLAPVAGERVLEIGTGTGWNAALLDAAGVNVTSVEIDPELARQARARLIENGCRGVVVLNADGATVKLGELDAVIATVGTTAIPWAWVMQTRIGGRLVVPLNGSWYPPGLAVLERTQDEATGRLAGPADFMRMRSQARSRAVPLPVDLAPAHTSTTTVHPYFLTGDRDAAVAIDQQTSGIRFTWRSPDDSAEGVLWIYGSDSWATIDATTGVPYAVEQAGPRQLVDEVLGAYRWWQDHGEPAVSDWRVTVTPDEQTIQQR